MEAGRELDALVAEKVMGYVVNRRDGGSWHLVGDHPFQARGRCCGSGLSPYSSDIGAAWDVVERMHTAYDYWLALEYNEPGLSDAEFRRVNSPYFGASAPTAPLAICLAALRAVGVAGPRHPQGGTTE